ncbi:NAD(P)/FAD-dependent oxidoreductase [Lapillicoccus jejuensis]|uniref:Amine oxidase domain-containing protein n=1 Tax=Lapillicoccus jejuensis TaxID=402171 RepID=A0A542DYX4_9MICO|nr:FAD-dependent oxidoreductase [Lapillicoccus jejuensis]TQJ08295.1 hypothetical protein FB458_1379 [Lapillicoccus jejuensis]
MTPSDPHHPLSVVVVGAGLSGAACARTLVDGGARVRLVERGRAPGGRMASPEVHGRRVDLGPGFVTSKDDEFGALLRDWERRGLATPWVDGTEVLGPDGLTRKEGPVRWAAPGGLRSLVRDVLGDPVAAGLHVDLGAPVDDLREVRGDADAVVLAMPDPQAARLAPDLLAEIGVVENDPTVAVATGWPERTWDLRCAFVNDDPDVVFVADDGSRRGDGAPVLVAHSSPQLAARVLAEADGDPLGAVPPVVAALRRLLDLGEPEWTHAMRWGMAKPQGTHETTYHLSSTDGGTIGLAGDQWAGGGTPRVESAWRSGVDLARALLAG